MGSGIGAIYSVPLEPLRRIAGSRKRSRKISQRVVRDFIGCQEIDEMFAEYDPPNTLGEAVAQIINGEPLEDDRGTLYGYAVEALCWYLGTTFILPIGFPPYEYLEAYLKPLGCPATLEELLFSGFLIPIPTPGDFPFAGHWLPEKVREMWAFLERTEVEEQEEGIAIGLQELKRWLKEAVDREPTDCLVGFYY
jgi:hypothetical protein